MEQKAPLLRSYEVILPSSLDPVISYALVYSTQLRELVLSTVNLFIFFFVKKNKFLKFFLVKIYRKNIKPVKY